MLALLVAYVFPPKVTDFVNATLNYLACCTMSLDTLDKLISFRDASFISYSMNILNALSCFIWGLYHQNNNQLHLALPNYAGLACSIALIPGVMYA